MNVKKIAIEKIKHFVSKEAFNIDGFGKKNRRKIFGNLIQLKLPTRYFNLDYKKIKVLEGWESYQYQI